MTLIRDRLPRDWCLGYLIPCPDTQPNTPEPGGDAGFPDKDIVKAGGGPGGYIADIPVKQPAQEIQDDDDHDAD